MQIKKEEQIGRKRGEVRGKDKNGTQKERQKFGTMEKFSLKSIDRKKATETAGMRHTQIITLTAHVTPDLPQTRELTCSLAMLCKLERFS
jgi:hypothetical protein